MLYFFAHICLGDEYYTFEEKCSCAAQKVLPHAAFLHVHGQVAKSIDIRRRSATTKSPSVRWNKSDIAVVGVKSATPRSVLNAVNRRHTQRHHSSHVDISALRRRIGPPSDHAPVCSIEYITLRGYRSARLRIAEG